MRRRQPRRQHQAVVVAVRHDQRADQPRRHAPGRRPGVRLLAASRSRNLISWALAKFWPRKCDVPACSALRSCIIASMRVGVDRAGKPLARRLLAPDDRHRHVLSANVGVHVEHLARLFAGLGLGGVGRVPFLPEKLGRPQKHPRPQLPADDVGPLVDENRQVAIRLHPVGVHGADDRLAGGPHDQRLFQLAGAGTQAALAARLPADGASPPRIPWRSPRRARPPSPGSSAE